MVLVRQSREERRVLFDDRPVGLLSGERLLNPRGAVIVEGGNPVRGRHEVSGPAVVVRFTKSRIASLALPSCQLESTVSAVAFNLCGRGGAARRLGLNRSTYMDGSLSSRAGRPRCGCERRFKRRSASPCLSPQCPLPRPRSAQKPCMSQQPNTDASCAPVNEPSPPLRVSDEEEPSPQLMVPLRSPVISLGSVSVTDVSVV